jgi:hypothetical protein
LGANRGDRFQSVLTFTDNFHIGHSREQGAKSLPREGFVIYHQDAHGLVDHEFTAEASLLSK